MKEPEIVPEKIKSPFDYRALIGIAALAISFHVYINYFSLPEDTDTIASIFSFLNPLIVAVSGFFISFRYKKSLVFGKSYLFLGSAYFVIFLGEVTYMIYDIVYNIEPYPSIADVFFFLQYPLLITHLILNIKFFSPKLKTNYKIWAVVMPIAVLIGYTALSTHLDEVEFLEFDFLYGVVFVYFAALTFSFAVIGGAILKEGIVGKAWMLLVIGVALTTIGDVWYYNLELFDAYDLIHPVNMFWYAGYWVIVYALYKHKKTI